MLPLFYILEENMLKDLDPVKIKISLGGQELYLRYNLNARRYLEEYMDVNSLMNKHDDEWTAEEVCHLLRAGLMDCFFDKNEKAINERNFSEIKPGLAAVGRWVDEAGMAEITAEILKGLILSLPKAEENFLKGVEK